MRLVFKLYVYSVIFKKRIRPGIMVSMSPITYPISLFNVSSSGDVDVKYISIAPTISNISAKVFIINGALDTSLDIVIPSTIMEYFYSRFSFKSFTITDGISFFVVCNV